MYSNTNIEEFANANSRKRYFKLCILSFAVRKVFISFLCFKNILICLDHNMGHLQNKHLIYLKESNFCSEDGSVLVLLYLADWNAPHRYYTDIQKKILSLFMYFNVLNLNPRQKILFATSLILNG